MQVIRTIVWVLLAIVVVLFFAWNWPVENNTLITIWPGLVWETKLPVPITLAFLLGFVPVWLVYRTARWRLGRRITTLESTIAAQRPAPPIGTTNQLDGQP